MVSVLASAHLDSLADLLRAFNHQQGVAVACKAFYNQLAHVGFARFMRAMLTRLLERLRLDTCRPRGRALSRAFGTS